jgi:vancomycin aglycone glucosyltransferase
MKLVLATFGSRGDVQPFVVLGHALVRAGHEVVLCAPDDFAGMAGGLPFQPIAHDFESQLDETEGRVDRMMGFIRKSIEQQIELLPGVVKGAQALVAASAVVAGPSMAEAFRIPYHYVSFCPRVQPSRFHPTPRAAGCLARPGRAASQWGTLPGGRDAAAPARRGSAARPARARSRRDAPGGGLLPG